MARSSAPNAKLYGTAGTKSKHAQNRESQEAGEWYRKPVDAANSIRLFGGWTGTGIPVRPLVNDNVLIIHYLGW